MATSMPGTRGFGGRLGVAVKVCGGCACRRQEGRQRLIGGRLSGSLLRLGRSARCSRLCVRCLSPPPPGTLAARVGEKFGVAARGGGGCSWRLKQLRRRESAGGSTLPPRGARAVPAAASPQLWRRMLARSWAPLPERTGAGSAASCHCCGAGGRLGGAAAARVGYGRSRTSL